MDLFNQNNEINLIHFDGIALYTEQILEKSKSDFYFTNLMNNIEWKNDEIILFGKKIITNRKVAWYADQEFEYSYSNTKKKAMYWTKELLELKMFVEKKTKTEYNSCLLNLYNDGMDGMSWHSDNEKTIEENSSIASLSLGAERKFLFKHKTSKDKYSLILKHGSLLEMKGPIQKFWLHSLPKTKLVKTARINLTFRKMIINLN